MNFSIPPPKRLLLAALIGAALASVVTPIFVAEGALHGVERFPPENWGFRGKANGIPG